MEITLNGIPISEEQCIGDSLPYINAAFITLKDKIIETSDAIGVDFLKKTEFIGFYPTTGGTIFGGVQIGAAGTNTFNSGSILRFGRTASTSDGDNILTLPTIFCGTTPSPINGQPLGNDLYINANSANAKILLVTGTSFTRRKSLILDHSGNVNAAAGNLCVGSETAATEKLEVIGNIKVTAPTFPNVILSNTSSLGQWHSRISFRSNNTEKYRIQVDPTQLGVNQFVVRDSAAAADRLVIYEDGRSKIAGNLGVGTEPDSNFSIRTAGSIYVGNALTITGTFNTAGITSTGPISGSNIHGTTGTFLGKVITPNLESTGPVSGTTGAFLGKVTTPELESTGPVSGTTGTFTGKVKTPDLESSGPVSGTTGTFTGKVKTPDLESSGLVSGTNISSSGPLSGTVVSGTRIVATAGTFTGALTSGGGIVTTGTVQGTNGTFINTLSGNTIMVGQTLSGPNTVATLYDLQGAYGSFSKELSAKELRVIQIAGGGGQYSGGYIYTSFVSVDQGLTAAKIDVTGNGIVGGAITIGGTATITGLTTINNNLTVTGNISSNGDIIGFQTSDERLKKNIVVIPDALSKIVDLRGCEFEWDETLTQPHLKGKSAGVIAQDVEKVFPQAVTTREDGYKAVRYEYIIPLLIEAVKDLQDEIEDLKAKLNT